MKYRWVADPDITQHGWLSVYDESGTCLATAEKWATPTDGQLHRMETYDARPGQMIPSGDPRWYTHCQDCGQSMMGQLAYYDYGQHHHTCPARDER